MKCIHHPMEDAVGACAKCGAGICQDCFQHSEYQLDGKPFCRKCNLEVMHSLLSNARKEMFGRTVKAIINAFFIGVGLWIYHEQKDLVALFFWMGLGGFLTAWRIFTPDLSDHVRMGVEQAHGDWDGTWLFLLIRVVFSFLLGSVLSPLMLIISIFKAWKASYTATDLKIQIEKFQA